MSEDVGKAFPKIQNPFMIKSLDRLEIEGIYPGIMKATYNKPKTRLMLSRENLKVFHYNQEQDKDPLFFSILFELLTRSTLN